MREETKKRMNRKLLSTRKATAKQGTYPHGLGPEDETQYKMNSSAQYSRELVLFTAAETYQACPVDATRCISAPGPRNAKSPHTYKVDKDLWVTERSTT